MQDQRIMFGTVTSVIVILSISFSTSIIATAADGTTVSYATTWAPDPMCPYPSDDDIYIPYPGDCSKYWRCRDGNKYEFSCPQGLWWHQEETKCDLPGDYCSDETTTEAVTTTTPSTTTEREVTTPDDGVDPRCEDQSTSFWPHPSDCSKYIECYKGISYDMQCPEGLYFSVNLTKCVNLEDTECCQDTGSCT